MHYTPSAIKTKSSSAIVYIYIEISENKYQRNLYQLALDIPVTIHAIQHIRFSVEFVLLDL